MVTNSAGKEAARHYDVSKPQIPLLP